MHSYNRVHFLFVCGFDCCNCGKEVVVAIAVLRQEEGQLMRKTTAL